MILNGVYLTLGECAIFAQKLRTEAERVRALGERASTRDRVFLAKYDELDAMRRAYMEDLSDGGNERQSHDANAGSFGYVGWYRGVLTAHDAANLLGLHVRTVTHHCQEGNFPGADKVGNSWRIPRESVEAEMRVRGIAA